MKTASSHLILAFALMFAIGSLFADDPQFQNNWKFTSEYRIDSVTAIDSLKPRGFFSVVDAERKADKYADKLRKEVVERGNTTFFVNVPAVGELRITVVVSLYSGGGGVGITSSDRAADVSEAVIEHKEYPQVPEQGRFWKNTEESKKIAKVGMRISSVLAQFIDDSGKVIDSLKQQGDSTGVLVKYIAHRTRAYGKGRAGK